MFKTIKNKIANFVRDIKNAFKKLFGISKSETIDVEVVTETVTNPDGSVTITRTEKANTTPKFKDICKKAKDKAMNVLNNFIDNPITTGAAIAAVFGTFRMITRPLISAKAKWDEKTKLYNDKTHMSYKLKRPLTRREQNIINSAQDSGAKIGDILGSWGVI